MIDGPFANNTTVEITHVDTSGSEHIAGYVFASAGVGTIAQEQRWVLYAGYIPLPGVAILKRPPPNLQYSDLASWQNAIHQGEAGPLWKSNASYVKVFTEAFPSIHDPMQPAPPFPQITLRTQPGLTERSARVEFLGHGGDTGGDQTSGATTRARTDPPGKRLSRGRSGFPTQDPVQIEERWTIIQYEVRTGELYGTSIDWSGELPNNYEYWVTLPAYGLPVVANAETKLAPADVSSLDEFLRAMRDEMSRTPGSTFTIASCAYLNGLPVDP